MRASSLTELARAGFGDLSEASRMLEQLLDTGGLNRDQLLSELTEAADPDTALRTLLDLKLSSPDIWSSLQLESNDAQRGGLLRLFGASIGLAQFILRHPTELAFVLEGPMLHDADAYRSSLLEAVQSSDGTAQLTGEDGWVSLRVRYRRHLAQIALVDVGSPSAASVFPAVAAALSDLAAAALEAALAVARASVEGGHGAGKAYSREEIEQTRLAVIAMGKCGARELNYVSDVDVIFVGEKAPDGSIDDDKALNCATRLATELMRAIHEVAVEPPLWQVDPNLRPEGKQGPLVRSLSSHIAYYERWAKNWEYQALMKARFVAGDADLGKAYVEQTRPFVWNSATNAAFVESAQRMRERVMEHIPEGERDYQLKLGAGGLRDVEFTVQLLQLVHGQSNETIRASATLDALAQLSQGGFIARTDGDAFGQAYRELRVLEHRLQLRHLTRTALMPSAPEDLRWLARASGLDATGEGLAQRWEATKENVRALHLKMFYAPLLTAVAELPSDEFVLTGSQAEARLAAIGFADPKSALRHIAALSKGVSRRATIQRNLLPVLLQWISDGADPDYGLLAFRRISDGLGTTPWYLRLLRDGAGAAQRMTKILSSSRFIGELMEGIPESVAWLEGDEELRPLEARELREEMTALATRHSPIEAAIPHLLSVRRREILRLAMGFLVGVLDEIQVASALTDVAETLLSVTLEGVRNALDATTQIEFAIVELGRLGGAELALSSDLDLMFVFRSKSGDADADAKLALAVVSELQRLLADPKCPLELDLDLRPEGKAGVRVRSLDSYRAYYERWSLTWEAQALLRARCWIGDRTLSEDFIAVIDETRYPERLTSEQVREVRKLKARVEAERLPQGADPTRHLKLGRGSVSDVEWLVQLLQLQHAHNHPELRVTSTLQALDAAVAFDLIRQDDAALLKEAWLLSSALRTAHLLWTNRSSDVLPRDRNDLDGIARIMGYPQGSTTQLEEHYLATTRRSRGVFERLFFDDGQAQVRTYRMTPR